MMPAWLTKKYEPLWNEARNIVKKEKGKPKSKFKDQDWALTNFLFQKKKKKHPGGKKKKSEVEMGLSKIAKVDVYNIKWMPAVPGDSTNQQRGWWDWDGDTSELIEPDNAFHPRNLNSAPDKPPHYFATFIGSWPTMSNEGEADQVRVHLPNGPIWLFEKEVDVQTDKHYMRFIGSLPGVVRQPNQSTSTDTPPSMPVDLPDLDSKKLLTDPSQLRSYHKKVEEAVEKGNNWARRNLRQWPAGKRLKHTVDPGRKMVDFEWEPDPHARLFASIRSILTKTALPVLVEPFEPLVMRAIELIESKSPGYFTNAKVNQVVVESGDYGHLGKVESDQPGTIFISVDKTKSLMGGGAEEEDIVKEIAITLSHEKGHIDSKFQGGEAPAEAEEHKMEAKMSNRAPQLAKRAAPGIMSDKIQAASIEQLEKLMRQLDLREKAAQEVEDRLKENKAELESKLAEKKQEFIAAGHDDQTNEGKFAFKELARYNARVKAQLKSIDQSIAKSIETFNQATDLLAAAQERYIELTGGVYVPGGQSANTKAIVPKSDGNYVPKEQFSEIPKAHVPEGETAHKHVPGPVNLGPVSTENLNKEHPSSAPAAKPQSPQVPAGATSSLDKVRRELVSRAFFKLVEWADHKLGGISTAEGEIIIRVQSYLLGDGLVEFIGSNQRYDGMLGDEGNAALIVKLDNVETTLGKYMEELGEVIELQKEAEDADPGDGTMEEEVERLRGRVSEMKRKIAEHLVVSVAEALWYPSRKTPDHSQDLTPDKQGVLPHAKWVDAPPKSKITTVNTVRRNEAPKTELSKELRRKHPEESIQKILNKTLVPDEKKQDTYFKDYKEKAEYGGAIPFQTDIPTAEKPDPLQTSQHLDPEGEIKMPVNKMERPKNRVHERPGVQVVKKLPPRSRSGKMSSLKVPLSKNANKTVNKHEEGKLSPLEKKLLQNRKIEKEVITDRPIGAPTDQEKARVEERMKNRPYSRDPEVVQAMIDRWKSEMLQDLEGTADLSDLDKRISEKTDPKEGPWKSAPGLGREVGGETVPNTLSGENMMLQLNIRRERRALWTEELKSMGRKKAFKEQRAEIRRLMKQNQDEISRLERLIDMSSNFTNMRNTGIPARLIQPVRRQTGKTPAKSLPQEDPRAPRSQQKQPPPINIVPKKESEE